MRTPKDRPDAGGDSRSATLGDLLRLAGVTASAPPLEPVAPVAPQEATPPTLRFAKKVVVRASRKGHGGKTATEVLGVLEGHDQLLTEWKATFGVGVRQEGDAVVLQGDQGTRLVPWLEARGARVVRG